MGEKAIKVIIISGYDYSAGRAVLFGADDLLAKPFQFDYLSNCIKVQLGDSPNIIPLAFSPVNEEITSSASGKLAAASTQ